MESKSNVIRKASLFTSNGLVDPRVLPGYCADNVQSINVVRKLQKLFELMLSKFGRRLSSANQ